MNLLIVGGSYVDSSDENNDTTVDWSELEPSAADKHQDYVFVAHVFLAIIVSILSFSDGWISWAYGTGLMTPVLLVITGIMYGLVPGINWYRDEFIPFIYRTHMIREFEADRFLNYKRMNRRTILVAGYLSLVIIQFAWSLITSFGATDDLLVIIIMLSLLFAVIVMTYLLVVLAWFSLFERLMKSMYSDIEHIVDIDNEMMAFRHAKRMEEKESDDA